MNRRIILSLSAMTALGFVFLPGASIAQHKSLKEQIIGTWSLVSSETVQQNGTRSPTFGPNAKGIAIFDHGGNYVFSFVSSNLPKFTHNNRNAGTAEENKAVVEGSLGHFGTYAVNEADSSFTLRIEGSTFPNWAGTEQKRVFTLAGDELKWITPLASGGGTAELVWRRTK
jgi:hypothetical protein